MSIHPRGIEFKSFVPAAYRAQLEALVFFNSCQNRVWHGIVDAIEKFGTPEIAVDGERLRVCLRGSPDVQSLFAVEAISGRPVGVAMYVRADLEHISVLHIGIAEDFASGGNRADEQLLLKLLRELRRCSRRVKGVQRLELFYASGRAGRMRNRLSA